MRRLWAWRGPVPSPGFGAGAGVAAGSAAPRGERGADGAWGGSAADSPQVTLPNHVGGGGTLMENRGVKVGGLAFELLILT
jgi:hypothetical protein